MWRSFRIVVMLQQLAVGHDRRDLVHRHDEHFFALPDRNPLEVRRFRRRLVRVDRRADARRLLRDDLGVLDPLLRAIQGLPQPRLSTGFKQIVHRVDLERANRVLVVRGHERDERQSRPSSASAPRRCHRAPASASRAARGPGFSFSMSATASLPDAASPTTPTSSNDRSSASRNDRAGRSSSATTTRSRALTRATRSRVRTRRRP